MKALVTTGRLVNIEIYDPDTKKVRKQAFRNKWLASSPNGRSMHICKVVRKNTTKKIPASALKSHKKFHGKNGSGKAWVGDCPEPKGKLKLVGWIKALTYSVPKEIKSPEKNPYHWHHAFGDTGHHTGKREPSYPPKYYPALYQDSDGNYFIRRRQDNIWKITDWIIG